MRFALILSFCALAMFCVLSGSASAAPATWTLVGVTFDDGGTASGSFDYDPDTNTYSNVNITTTNGTSRTGAAYAFVCTPPCIGSTPNPSGLPLLTADSTSNLVGLPTLGITFSPSLDSAKAAQINFGAEADCTNSVCEGFAPPIRSVVSGGVFLAVGAVPTLSEWAVIVLVLSLLAVGTWQLARSRAR